MNKGILKPDKKDLFFLDKENINVYNYLRAKAVETIIMQGIKYPHKGMLKTSYNITKENEDIVRSICKLYPNEIKYTDIIKYDSKACLELLERKKDRTIYNLDYLSDFSTGVQSNKQIVIKTLDTLREKLTNTPQYRFEYKESELLNNIFNGKGLDYQFILSEEEYPIVETLMDIDPIYRYLGTNNKIAEEYLPIAMNNYLERYGIDSNEYPEYQRKDACNILNPDIKVKRLLRCIYKEKY